MPSNLLSFNLQGLTLEDAYTKLDEEISQLEARIFALRFLRNSLSPISKIPAEILSKIFTSTQKPIGLSFPDEVDTKAQFGLSWVCRHWRDIALATPSLWTVIYKNSTNRALDTASIKELLQRSRNRNISLSLIEPTTELLEVVSPLMHRIQHLKLANMPRCEAADGLLSEPAPVLSSLEFVNTITALEPFFSGTRPKLHYLILRNMNFNVVYMVSAPTITTLHVVKSTFNIEIEELLDLLPSLPNLTELVIAPSFEHEDVTPLSPRLQLPRLQFLSLTDTNMWTSFGLLRSLDIPHTAITVAWPADEDCSQDRLDDFVEIFDQYREQISLPIHHIKLERYFPNFIFEISASPTQHRHSLQFPDQEFSEENTNFFFHSLPFDHLESISTNDFPVLVGRALEHSTSLKAVTLYEFEAAQHFLNAFPIDPEVTEVPFPSVKELTICNVDESLESTLQKALTSRSKASLRLDRLAFVHCIGIDLGKFRDLVEVVAIED